MDDDYMYGQEEAEEEDDQDSEDEPKKGVAKTVEANLKQAIANSAKNASAKGVVSDESDIEDEEDLDEIDLDAEEDESESEEIILPQKKEQKKVQIVDDSEDDSDLDDEDLDD